MNMKSHYVYMLIDKDQQVYVGRRTCEVDPYLDKYFGSYSNKSFKPILKTILCTCSTFEELYNTERDLIISLKDDKSITLINKSIPSNLGDNSKPFSTFGMTHSLETLEKNRKAQTGKKASAKTKLLMSRARKGKKLSVDAREKLSQQRLGKNNPRYKGEKINWYNPKEDILELQTTVLELSKKYSLCETNLYALKNGRCNSHKGWILYTL